VRRGLASIKLDLPNTRLRALAGGVGQAVAGLEALQPLAQLAARLYLA
jgi:hypothetical protein